MNISDKTISKWERGLGCPDLSLISELSEILELDIKNFLDGDLIQNDFVGGNMKNSKYYVFTPRLCSSVQMSDRFCCHFSSRVTFFIFFEREIWLLALL